MDETCLHGKGGGPRRRSALGRSFDIYYRDHARTARMDRLNAMLVPHGASVFDIGGHVGDRTGSFLRQGASVVTLEPQPGIFRVLRRLYGRCPRASLLPLAAGSSTGEIALHVNSVNPTVSTAAPAFIKAARDAPGWQQEVWDQTVAVPVTTLDTLISHHGVPDFAKIDVEGHELAVLQGLSVPLPLVSFEFTTIQRGAAEACIDRLNGLGEYRYNFSLGEEHALRHGTWLGPDALRRSLAALPDGANSGDIYARLAS